MMSVRAAYDSTLEATAAYRRRARRLRATLAGSPADLLTALSSLASQQDRSTGVESIPARLRHAFDDGFGQFVDERIARGALRFSDRVDLIRAGERVGIDRFKANLIIADRLHRADPPPQRGRPTSIWKAAIAIELLLIGMAAFFIR